MPTPPSRRHRRRLRATPFLLLSIPASLACADVTWTPAGPAPTLGGQVEGMTAQNSPVDGAVKSLVVAPNDSSGNTVYVGTVNGGVWKTTNFLTASPNGPTWTPLTDFQTSLSIGALRLDPTDASGNTLV